MRGLESWVLTYLVNSLWQVPLLLAAGLLAARLARRVSAAAEHAVWLWVVLLQSLLPALTIFPGPDWARGGWQWLALWAGRAPSAAGARVRVEMGPVTGLSGFHIASPWLPALGAIYVLVTAGLGMRLLANWLRLARVRGEAATVALPEEAAVAWDLCAARFGTRDASLAVSPRVSGPVTLGLRRRLVLLPPEMLAGLTVGDLRAVLAHECAHLRRYDYVVNLLLQLIALPVAYHPLSAFAHARLAEAREMICDGMAAEVTGPKDYARSLLRLAALMLEGRPLPVPHAIGLFDANALERRLMKLTGKQGEMRGARRLAAVLACATFGVGVCGSALAMGMHVNAAPVQSADAAPTKYPKRVAVSAGIMASQRISGPQPVYPDVAKKAKVQGTVVLKAVIGKDGKMKMLKVKSGPPLLQGSAISAVKDWVYKPYLLNGDPVEVETEINVIYTLADSGEQSVPSAAPSPAPQAR